MIDFLRNALDPLFVLMGATLSTFHGWGAPWWLSIMMLTIIVRGLLFPITYRQVKSMRKMQDLKPDMDRIRSEYKDDVQTQRAEMAKLYQERKVNPLGGCLPVFIQLPIFLVLYYTIRQFDKLESFRTGGLLWFQDLTQPDHLFVLPVLYILTMMASQEITIRNTASQQKQLMRFLPIIFGFFLARFPSGLFVYWITSLCHEERAGETGGSPGPEKERPRQEQKEKEGRKEEITQGAGLRSVGFQTRPYTWCL
jgi:YidC/Oxa1 family membrane protein insertase